MQRFVKTDVFITKNVVVLTELFFFAYGVIKTEHDVVFKSFSVNWTQWTLSPFNIMFETVFSLH